jgi:1-aminocyclopropane-1-carboxylate deaminase/D-cysteine desulfhydrase-like pyridoxal-dependent ACC family enzyme
MKAQFFDRLDALPRERLALLPTPLSPAAQLGAAIGLPGLWIKHDELIGFGFGGNKVRGLELLLADARAQGADVLVTGAGAQSNHVRATAAAAAYAGMDAHAVYWGEPPAAVEGNLLLTRMLGAATAFTHSSDRSLLDGAIAAAAADLHKAGRRPYSIPRGGACALGVLGHALAARELLQQCHALNLYPTRVLMAVGSGGTLAGWLLGSAALGAPWRVEGVTVSRPADEARARVLELATQAAALLGQEPLVQAQDVRVHDGFIGPGYGIPSPQGQAAILLAARQQAVFFDPTYTGKAFAGLRAQCADPTWGEADAVVFIHSGGEPALFTGPCQGLAT